MKGTKYMLIGMARSREGHLFAGHLSLCLDNCSAGTYEGGGLGALLAKNCKC